MLKKNENYKIALQEIKGYLNNLRDIVDPHYSWILYMQISLLTKIFL